MVLLFLNFLKVSSEEAREAVSPLMIYLRKHEMA